MLGGNKSKLKWQFFVQAPAITLLAAADLFLAAPHPHRIQNSRDAIATAHAVWLTNYPESGIETEREWQSEFTAVKEGNLWIIRQKDHTGDPGVVIYLDASDGHIKDFIVWD